MFILNVDAHADANADADAEMPMPRFPNGPQKCNSSRNLRKINHV